MAKSRIIAVAGFIILVNLFFFRMFGSTALTILSAGFFIYLVLVLPVSQFVKKHETAATVLSVLTLVPLILMELRASMVIQTGLFLTFLTSLGFSVYLVTTNRTGIGSAAEFILALPWVFLSHVTNLLKMVVSFLDTGTSGRSVPARRVTTLIIGLALGLPFAALLLGLLTGADPIFAKAVSQITRYLTFDRIWWRVTGSVIALLIAAPFAGIVVRKTPVIPNRFPPDLSDVVSAVIFLMAVIAGSFLVVQWPYVFATVASETDLSRFGVATYSEYVRRGFAELLTAGVLMYAASWVGYVSERSHKPVRKFAFLIQMALLGELGLFIVSVIRRVLLYWQFHGLTLVRIYGGLFLIAILILTAILILRHFFRKTSWIKAEIAALIFMAFFTGTWNAERYLVHHHPPTVNNRVDYVYLSRLSADGYDGWLVSYRWAKDTIRKDRMISPADLTEDDLRQLSYAGAIIGTVTRSYLKMTDIYASPGIRQHAADLLRDHYLTHLEAYRDDVKSDLALLERNASASGRLDRLIDSGGDAASKKRTLETQMTGIESKLTYLTGYNHASVLPVGFYRFRPSYVFRAPDFSRTTCTYERVPDPVAWCMPEYYTFSQVPQNEPTATDRLYRWNAKTAGVYGKLAGEIPLPELLNLQDDFMAIHRQLLTLPGSAKGVPWDISTETVFLESF